MRVTDPVSPPASKAEIVLGNKQWSARVDNSRAISCIVKI